MDQINTVLRYQIDEYSNGLRRLVKHTCHLNEVDTVVKILENNQILYHISEDCDTKVQLFFGEKVCIEVIKTFVTKPLYTLDDYEDFILGTLLGYDTIQQCERFLGNVNATWRE